MVERGISLACPSSQLTKQLSDCQQAHINEGRRSSSTTASSLLAAAPPADPAFRGVKLLDPPVRQITAVALSEAETSGSPSQIHS